MSMVVGAIAVGETRRVDTVMTLPAAAREAFDPTAREHPRIAHE